MKQQSTQETDINLRKKEHIDLAFQSQVKEQESRFYYEPALAGHPDEIIKMPIVLAEKPMDFPIWISSMTGGAAIAKEININLAKVAAKFKLGMGLGSCRVILNDNQHLEDFALRKYIGNQPLFVNLGIAQINFLIRDNQINKVLDLIKKTEADGLIIHINPLQEWLQPNGDRYYDSPVDLIEKTLNKINCPIMVKEVGQGFGPKSLEALLKLPLEALDYGALGGTNFSQVELLRNSNPKMDALANTKFIGHTAIEMTDFVNSICSIDKNIVKTKRIIVSGGISSFLDGYYHLQKLALPSLYGQASALLKYAQIGYEPLEQFVAGQIEGLQLANQFLTLKR